MKELTPESNLPKEGIIIERQIKQAEKFQGDVRLKKGQKLYKFKAGQISEVQDEEYESISLGIETGIGNVTKTSKKLKNDPQAIYIPAINIKVAAKKLIKLLKRLNINIEQ